MAESDPILDALWAKVLEDFAAPRAHQAFIDHCRQSERLPEAAKRYRDHKERLAEDDEAARAEADRRLGAIAMLAMAQLDANRSPPGRSRLLQALTLVMAILTLAAMVGLIRALLL
jgi:hypothetical protein